MWQDSVNGLWEVLGGLFILLSVLKLLRDKQVRGVSWIHVLFFTVWGHWNLYYYPHLGQWVSFCGGMGVMLTNTVWLLLLLYYSRRPRKLSAFVDMWGWRDPIDIMNITEDDVDLPKIAKTLSHLCRYGGRIDHFYSVAEHCVYASEWASHYGIDPALALLHDASEAFIGDVIGSYKRQVAISDTPIKTIENRMMKTILFEYGLTPTEDELGRLHSLDVALRMEEIKQLGITLSVGEKLVPRPGCQLPTIGMDPRTAEKAFLSKAKELMLR